MEAIEAVVALVKERDDLSETLSEYEDWFDSLVGKCVSLKMPSKKNKNKVKYISVFVFEFIPGEGWEAHDDKDNVYEIDFMDFVKGDAWILK